MNRLYRHVSGIKGTGPLHIQPFPESRHPKRTKVVPREIEEFYPSKSSTINHGKQRAKPPGVVDVVPSDLGGRSEQRVQKSVTWFRTSLRRRTTLVDDN